VLPPPMKSASRSQRDERLAIPAQGSQLEAGALGRARARARHGYARTKPGFITQMAAVTKATRRRGPKSRAARRGPPGRRPARGREDGACARAEEALELRQVLTM